ncbi:Dbl homology domain-containing protein [Mycena polygramma]|nr:Dbl homology domain-containing protein [Mycena polygramma]
MWKWPMMGRSQERARNIIRELVDTEKKYVQDLETLHKYASALTESGLLPKPTIKLLFSNLTELLGFQRKFLRGLEETYKLPWKYQHWGRRFLEAEEEFGTIYAPYYLNYYINELENTRANNNPQVSNRVLQMKESLAEFNDLMNMNYELPAFLVKPVSRVCKYPLLIDSLLKTCSSDTSPRSAELKNAAAAMRRVTQRCNDAARKVENEQTASVLRTRVVDWQGHRPDTFGALLLDDLILLRQVGVDQECHVFLFERIVLFCSDTQAGVPPAHTNIRPRRRTTPFRLERHVLVRDVMQTEAAPNPTPAQREYALDVWWSGERSLEVLKLLFQSEYTRSEWEAQLRRLIRECAERRADERCLRRSSQNQSKPL